jgi:hypothetical protein
MNDIITSLIGGIVVSQVLLELKCWANEVYILPEISE